MKLRKTTSGFAALAGVAILCTACPKKRIQAEPQPDTEFQSSVDASYALQAVTDIDQITAYVCELQQTPASGGFFWESPGSAPDRKVSVSSNGAGVWHASFNKVLSRDGHYRDGTLRVIYNPENVPNEDYYRDYSFDASVVFFQYRVDDFQVTVRNDFKITNLVPSFNFDPKTTKLSWSITGDLDLKHITDASKNMHVNVNLVKTLVNTADPQVYTGRETPIKWAKARFEYTGTVTGETPGGVPYKYAISNSRPLLRDLQCSPEQAQSLGSSGQPRSVYQELHPFIDGVAEMTTADKYPRVIYYGAEDGSAPACDNSGIIMIKGISYPIDFRREYK